MTKALPRCLLAAALRPMQPAAPSGCFLAGPQVGIPAPAPNATVVIDAGGGGIRAIPSAISLKTVTAAATAEPPAKVTAQPACELAVDTRLDELYALAGGRVRLGCVADARVACPQARRIERETSA